MKIEDFRKIFRSSFSDPEEWLRWFMDACVEEDRIYMAAAPDGKTASAMLMQPFDFIYESAILPTAYISCVATLPEYRSKGLSSGLMKDALHDLYSKGFAMAELIPAEEHLFYFYKNRGFATVFYADVEYYTSLHTFRPGRGNLSEPSFEVFHELELHRGCGVIHTRDDYERILADMNLDGEPLVLAATDEEGRKGMLFAVADAGQAKVKWLIADSEYAARTLLVELRRRVGEKDVKVITPPDSGNEALMRPYGMARILRPLPFLEALASAHPEFKSRIRITDTLIPGNTGIYTVGGGRCTFDAADRSHDVGCDLDVSIETFAAVVFSSHKISEITGVPARRPSMGLMLDE